MVKEFGITYDVRAYGDKKTSPIALSYATFNYPAVSACNLQFGDITNRSWIRRITAQGDARGWRQSEQRARARCSWSHVVSQCARPCHRHSLCGSTSIARRPRLLIPLSQSALTKYYTPNKGRKNLHLITHTRVNEITFDKHKHATGVTYQVRDTTEVLQVKATKEVIVTAGAIHTPQVLQRSGIGPAALLKKANVPVLVDLPGVGSNFQDHAAASTTYVCM